VTEALQYVNADKVKFSAPYQRTASRLDLLIVSFLILGPFYRVQVVVQAAQAGGMSSDGDSEVSDGDDATNEQLQQRYLHGGGMMDGGSAATTAAHAGSFMFSRHVICRRVLISL
jgi:hypothetical protein